MEIIAVLKLISAVFSSTIEIIIGLLLVKHQQLIAHYKDAFTFIRSDYSVDAEQGRRPFLKSFLGILKEGIVHVSGKGHGFKSEKRDLTNEFIVLVGQLLIAVGLLGIITAVLATFWMVYKEVFGLF